MWNLVLTHVQCCVILHDPLFMLNCCTLPLFKSRRRHTSFDCDWSSDVCSSDLGDDVTDAVGADVARAVVEDADAGARAGANEDRKSGVQGKRVDLGGRRII